MALHESLGAFLMKFSERLRGFPPGVSALALRQILHEFRRVGATNRPSAQRFRAATGEVERTFLWLVRLEIVREVTPGRYYLDEEELAARNVQRMFE